MSLHILESNSGIWSIRGYGENLKEEKICQIIA